MSTLLFGKRGREAADFANPLVGFAVGCYFAGQLYQIGVLRVNSSGFVNGVAGLSRRDALRVSTEVYMGILAQAAAMRATCPRRAVGAVASFRGVVVSTGYNGSPPSMKHCTDEGCLMVGNSCVRTTHAEVNCMARRDGREVDLVTVTTQPCLNCCKELLAHGVPRVHYLEPYPSEERDTYLRDLGLIVGSGSHWATADWMRHVSCPRLQFEETGAAPVPMSVALAGLYKANHELVRPCAGCKGTRTMPVPSRYIGGGSSLVSCDLCDGTGEFRVPAPWGWCLGGLEDPNGCPNKVVFQSAADLRLVTLSNAEKTKVGVCADCFAKYQREGLA